MAQDWWVNQTRNHEFERSVGIVAGEIKKENPSRTHYGRANVSRMDVDDLLVCYIGKGRIDCVARVTERSIEPKKAPWPGSDKDAKAYIAKVKYFSIKPTIQKEEFIDKMLEFGYYSKGPITRNRNISQGYAFELEGDRFDFLIGLRNLSRSDFRI